MLMMEIILVFNVILHAQAAVKLENNIVLAAL